MIMTVFCSESNSSGRHNFIECASQQCKFVQIILWNIFIYDWTHTETINQIVSNSLLSHIVVSKFPDYKKDFDYIDHIILIRKLYAYGMRGDALMWFQSFLNGREQFVSIKNVTFPNCNLGRGIPQGSIYGNFYFFSDFH